MKIFEPVRLNPWREIAIQMLIVMEVSWITPWFRSLTPETYALKSGRVFIVLLIIVIVSHLLVRISRNRSARG
jgi:flagellar biogenesis protein FliO